MDFELSGLSGSVKEPAATLCELVMAASGKLTEIRFSHVAAVAAINGAAARASGIKHFNAPVVVFIMVFIM